MKRRWLLVVTLTVSLVVFAVALSVGQGQGGVGTTSGGGIILLESPHFITTYFAVYETADGVKVEHFPDSPLEAVRQFLKNGFAKMVWDGTDCNKCDSYAGYSSCTTMFCPNYVPDRPKPKNPKLIGIFRGESIPFTTETVEKKVAIETETIYRVGE